MAHRATRPALLAVRQAVRRSLPPQGSVLVACSGGADSLALAGAVALEAPGRGGLVTVDHGLQAGSGDRAQALLATARELGLNPCEAVRVEVDARAGDGPEAAARDARYAALDRVGERQGSAVWLAHTRDDQAEQVLLGLARGSGARSLAGMPRTRGRYVRPLLDLPRAVVRAACGDLGLSPWEDPHNDDPAFARSRVRHRVLPVLEAELGPGIAAALVRTATHLAADADALAAWARAELDRCRAEPDPVADGGTSGPAGAWRVDRLARLHPAVLSRVLRLAAAEAGVTAPTAVHTEAMVGLVTRWRGQAGVALPGGSMATRRDGLVGFTRPG